jgi:signal transduction histidine kinase
MSLRARRVPLDFAQTRVRRLGFWSGWFGLSTTAAVFLSVIALLVGWVIAYATDDEPHVWLLILGPIAFSGVLVTLAALYVQLRGAERLRQAENAFLTGASHNLRTPLSAIRAATQTLADEGIAPEDRRMLIEAVLHETNRLELRIDTLLETARIDFERRPYLTERIDLVALLSDIVRDARWAVAIRQGTFRFAVEDTTVMSADGAMVGKESIPAIPVNGDRRALRIMFENLIDNAIKSAHEGLTIEILLRRSGDHGVVRVRDHGVGFDIAEAETLFSGRRPGDTRRRGTGLGLPLSRAIARGHHGELRLDSPGVGEGALAEVWLPLAEDAEAGRIRVTGTMELKGKTP